MYFSRSTSLAWNTENPHGVLVYEYWETVQRNMIYIRFILQVTVASTITLSDQIMFSAKNVQQRFCIGDVTAIYERHV